MSEARNYSISCSLDIIFCGLVIVEIAGIRSIQISDHVTPCFWDMDVSARSIVAAFKYGGALGSVMFQHPRGETDEPRKRYG